LTGVSVRQAFFLGPTVAQKDLESAPLINFIHHKVE